MYDKHIHTLHVKLKCSGYTFGYAVLLISRKNQGVANCMMVEPQHTGWITSYPLIVIGYIMQT